MRNTSVELVKQVVMLIEDSLNEPLLLDNIACSVFVSKYHLHRLFKTLTGRTLMSYVRGRRLSLSINDLLNTQEKLSYIAEMYGFSYEQSYERAFKSQFGMTPSEFRSAPIELEIVHMLDTSTIRDIASGIFVAPRFLVLPDMMFAGIRHNISLQPKQPTAANEAALRFCDSERKSIHHRINEHLYYGFTYDVHEQSYRYMSCVETNQISQLPTPFESFVLPSHLYAVFRYVGFHGAEYLSEYTLDEIYNYISVDWCAKTDYRRDKDYMFERVDATVCKSTYCEMDIFLPVDNELNQ